MSVWVYRLNNNLWEEFHIKWSFCLYFIIRFDDGTTIISFVLLNTWNCFLLRRCISLKCWNMDKGVIINDFYFWLWYNIINNWFDCYNNFFEFDYHNTAKKLNYDIYVHWISTICTLTWQYSTSGLCTLYANNILLNFAMPSAWGPS